MNFARTFTYVFDDPEWISKIVILIALTLASVFFPIGLIALVAVLGYMMETAAHVRGGQQHPLPKWEHYPEKMTAGANLLLATFVYNLPVLLIGGCSTALLSSTGDDLLAGGLVFAVLCCLFPIMIAYSLVTWPMLAVGTIRYMETGQGNVFFQISDIFETLQNNTTLTMQWLLYSFTISIAFGVLMMIPCLGWLVALALMFPAHAHLLGQYARRLDRKAKGKPRPGTYQV